MLKTPSIEIFPWQSVLAQVLFVLTTLSFLGAKTVSAPSRTILLVGDSIMTGEGDSGSREGIPGRLAELFPHHRVEVLSFPGASLHKIHSVLSKRIQEPGSIERKKISSANVIVLSAGVNDYWRGNLPHRTVEDLRTLTTFLFSSAHTLKGEKPSIVVASLTPTTHEGQRRWIRDVNALALSGAYQRLPMKLRFDQLPVTSLIFDGLHPSGQGYDSLARKVQEYLCGLPEDRFGEEGCDASLKPSDPYIAPLLVTNEEKRLARRRPRPQPGPM